MADPDLEPQENGNVVIDAIKFFGISPGDLLAIATSIFLAELLKRTHPEIFRADGQGEFYQATIMGFLIWTVYRKLLGAYLIWPISQCIHFIIDSIFMKIYRREPHSSFTYLNKVGVRVLEWRSAYCAIEDFYLPAAQFPRVSAAHGEIYVVDLCLIYWLLHIFVSWIHTRTLSPSDIAFDSIVAVILWIVTLMIDAQQHSKEVRALQHPLLFSWNSKPPSITPAEFLEAAGFRLKPR